jgi:cytochrome c oxidase cbb3-type subunit 3
MVWSSACKRETRRFDEGSAASQPADSIQMGDLVPGGALGKTPTAGPYDDNAFAVNQGQQFFQWFNCVGCHSHGGGGMGPPLLDAKWINGSDPQNLFATIVEGRPNGMPSYRGKIPVQQVWQLVAYVRSLGGLARLDVAAGRPDSLQSTPPGGVRTPERPVPAPAEQP